jgi:hypothetical protein
MTKERKTEPETKKATLPTAAAVREEIERLAGRSEAPKSSEDPPRPKSPRSFIQERMQELDKKKHV